MVQEGLYGQLYELMGNYVFHIAVMERLPKITTSLQIEKWKKTAMKLTQIQLFSGTRKSDVIAMKGYVTNGYQPIATQALLLERKIHIMPAAWDIPHDLSDLTPSICTQLKLEEPQDYSKIILDIQINKMTLL